MTKKRITGHVVWVHFFEPIGGKCDYYFGSLQAIYEAFTPAQIGCRLYRLYGVSDSRPVTTKTCQITKHQILRIPHRANKSK